MLQSLIVCLNVSSNDIVDQKLWIGDHGRTGHRLVAATFVGHYSVVHLLPSVDPLMAVFCSGLEPTTN